MNFFLRKAKVGVDLLYCKSFHMSFHLRSRVKFWLLPWRISSRSLCLTCQLLFPDPLYPDVAIFAFFLPPSPLPCLRSWTWESISSLQSLVSHSSSPFRHRQGSQKHSVIISPDHSHFYAYAYSMPILKYQGLLIYSVHVMGLVNKYLGRSWPLSSEIERKQITFS